MDRVQKNSKSDETLLPKVPPHDVPQEAPSPRNPRRFPARMSQKGMLTFAELGVGMLIISLLVVATLMVLRVTEKGTINQKKKEQALDLAKQKAEEVKAYLNTLNWDNIKVDVRFPPTQTPVVPSYNSYPGTTITLGKNTFILNTEVRYIYDASATQLAYIPTPATAQTPEIGNIVRIRTDAYYGNASSFIPLATAEATSITLPRMVYSNILSSKTLNIGETGSISGYVYGGPSGCNTSYPINGVEVGLYSGAQKTSSVFTNIDGLYTFTNVQEGIYSIQVVSSPGYDSIPGDGCNFLNPLTLVAGNNLNNERLGVVPLAVWNYYGVAVTTNPVIDAFPPTSPTPTPVAMPTVVPIPNAVVYADDGNSVPVTADAGGNFLVTQVRATPVAGHSYDTIGADHPLTVLTGKAYNSGLTMYPNYVSGGQTYIGPITVYVNSTVGNKMPVTFVFLDETYNPMPAFTYPATLSVADGTSSPPVTILSYGVSQVALTVREGIPNVQLSLNNNSSPIAFVVFNQTVPINAAVTSPITMLNFAVGSASGTLLGMGVYNYTQFRVRAHDDQGQYTYDIPVSYSSGATFGTFNYSYFRAPLASPSLGELDYTFDVAGLGDYTSNLELLRIRQGVSTPLANPLLVAPLNVYMSVTVTNKGAAYAYGSWVSAQPCTVSCGPPTTGMGSGFNVSNYYSGVTKGDGTAVFPVQLVAASATTYAVSAQIIDPTTYSLSTTTLNNVVVNSSNTYFAPKGVSIGF